MPYKTPEDAKANRLARRKHIVCKQCGKDAIVDHRAKSFCSLKCAYKWRIGPNNPNYGKHPTEEMLEKDRRAHIGKHPDKNARHKMSISHQGSNCVFWKGGISFEPYCPKFNKELKRRVREFFNNMCIICSEKDEKEELSVHHVEYNKQACCDGELVHFAATCRKHHAMTNSDRDRWESMLHRIIDEIYDGRSYYTKEEYYGV